MERKALEMEKSRGADDQVDQMSQALNRLRAMVSLPKYPRQCRGPRRATPDRWRKARNRGKGSFLHLRKPDDPLANRNTMECVNA